MGLLEACKPEPDEVQIGRIEDGPEGELAFQLMQWKTKRLGRPVYDVGEYYRPVYIKKYEYTKPAA
jgi:hypothetical protein